MPSRRPTATSTGTSSSRPSPPSFRPSRSTPKAPLMIAYTSGTTGGPRGPSTSTAGSWSRSRRRSPTRSTCTRTTVLCWVTDLGWIMGPWELVGGLAAGGTVVLLEGVPDYPAPDRLWSLVERHGVTILGVSPTLIRALMRARHRAGPIARPVPAADSGLDRRAVGPRVVALAVRARRRGPLSDHQHLGRDGGRRLPAVGACRSRRSSRARWSGPSLGMAVDVFDADGQAAAARASASWSAPSRGRR